MPLRGQGFAFLITLPHMRRRWLLVALLYLLPAQFLWAAVAPYCAHEAAPVSYHLGHHPHEHSTTLDSRQQPDRSGDTAGVGHSDCSQCHPSQAQFVSDLELPATLPHVDGFGALAARAYASRIEPNIERPKWSHAG